MRDELVPAKNVGVYWVEHVLRHNGTAHLQSWANKEMPFYQFYLLDVFLFLISFVLVTVLILFKCIRWASRKLLGSSSSVKVKDQ